MYTGVLHLLYLVQSFHFVLNATFGAFYSTEDTLIINTILLTYTKEIKKILAFFLLAQHCLEHTQKC